MIGNDTPRNGDHIEIWCGTNLVGAGPVVEATADMVKFKNEWGSGKTYEWPIAEYEHTSGDSWGGVLKEDT